MGWWWEGRKTAIQVLVQFASVPTIELGTGAEDATAAEVEFVWSAGEEGSHTECVLADEELVQAAWLTRFKQPGLHTIGKVFARVTPRATRTPSQCGRRTHTCHSLPPDAVVSAGLDSQRQWYLYNSIREFVKYVNKDPFPTPTHRPPERCEPSPPPKRARGSGRRGARSRGRGGVTPRER
ncbi:hypothetical protein LSAT2_017840 [Lamellibrachia satsuma]|nr:hypothetical protein LSAT2_017840 [Lamellibrachia satsuma]